MNLSNLIDIGIQLAKTAAALIPGGQLAVSIGEKVLDLVDNLQEHATVDQQPELQSARATLARAVEAKAHATADRLRG